MIVEFHPAGGAEQDFDLSDDPQFWQRCLSARLANDVIAFESPTDLLLHLIVHAVYDHHFNNGPLLLSDLAYLLDAQTIDWPLFWALAERGRHTRGCMLALKLTERYWGAKPIIWPEGSEAHTASVAAQLDQAALLMLCEAPSDVKLGTEVARQTSLTAKLWLLLGKAFPPKVQIAATYPVSEHSLLVYLWYPVRWWKLLTWRLPDYFRSRQQSQFQRNLQQLAELERWLAN